MCTNEPLRIVPAIPLPTAISVPVLKVFDGDGFLTRIDSCTAQGDLFDASGVEISARLGFIDAPELEQPGGPEARDFLTSLIGGRDVLIDVLIKMDTGRTVDRYGRMLCVPYLRKEYTNCEFVLPSNERHRANSTGKTIILFRNIEMEMVLNGWAWVIEKYGPDEQYFAALEDAQNNRRGIWAMEENIPPWTFKRQKALEFRQKARAKGAGQACPQHRCGGRLLLRKGKYGDFLGCSNFPDCRYSQNVCTR